MRLLLLKNYYVYLHLKISELLITDQSLDRRGIIMNYLKTF